MGCVAKEVPFATAGTATLKIAADVESAIEALVEAGWLRGIGERAGDTAGKPRKDYLINPRVHDGVANGVAAVAASVMAEGATTAPATAPAVENFGLPDDLANALRRLERLPPPWKLERGANWRGW